MSDVVALGLAGASACGLVNLWLVLRFLRHVYNKGGADDMRKAASALRTIRWWSALPNTIKRSQHKSSGSSQYGTSTAEVAGIADLPHRPRGQTGGLANHEGSGGNQ